MALLDQLQSALGTSYSLERELGGGGMARVFVAEDARLRRKIVVKVLSPSLAEGLSAERFEREIVLAARLQHPNIVPVLNAGDANGLPYYTMPYVRGESLRVRLAGGTPPDFAHALGILRDVARALAYAHGEGVVHRDIKPENILLSDDVAVVADFGIAKAIDAARSRAAATLTSAGTSLGTPAYMAPEQAAADPNVDARADLYAWGIVAYEMLAGAHPFSDKRTPHEMIVAHMVEMPPALSALRPELPAGLSAVVMQCLEKDPERRPRAASEIVAALGAVPASASGPQPATAAAAARAAPSIAVLPFTNMSADAENEFFADGITEEILSALAHVRGIRLASRTSTSALKGQRLSVRDVASKLGVSTVLEGSVRKSGTRVRITAQLVNAADGMQLWSERFDRELSDIFAIQDEIATHVAKALAETLAGTGRTPPAGTVGLTHVVPRREVKPEAFELYLHAKRILDQRMVGIDEAIAQLGRAVAIDPEFALGWAWLGLAHLDRGFFNVEPPRDAFPKARDPFQRALALDPTNSFALYGLGAVQLFYDWDVAAALATDRAAAASAPGSAVPWLGIGWAEAAAGRRAEALRAVEHAYGLDPHDSRMFLERPYIMLVSGAADRACEVYREGLRLYPGYGEIHRQYGMALRTLGDMAGARRELEIALPLTHRNPWTLTDLATVRAALGDRAGTLELLKELESRAEHQWIPPLAFSAVHCALGDFDRGFEYLERSLEVHDFWLPMAAKADPYMLQWADDPRYQAIIARVKPSS